MSDWISVEDELPSHDKPLFITYCNDGEIHSCMDIWYDYHEKGWMRNGPMDSYGHYKGKVTHWMTYPRKPNGEKE